MSGSIILKFGEKNDIKGKCKIVGFEDCININKIGFDTGRFIDSTNDQRNPGVASHSEISLEKISDMASPCLWLDAIKGVAHEKAYIYITQTAGNGNDNDPYIVLTLNDAIVSSYDLLSTGDRPTEHFNLSFTAMNFSYKDVNGAMKEVKEEKCWDYVQKKETIEKAKM
ncbi:Hemolysin-coregulated protein (uncharacterized) [Serratia proteamaculans]|uniref:type VI secretion system tube protein Hcp n=1 Tax=Serratia proteamaculans TaxID=28151 RepID=UPI002182EDF9|nr:type VI secretion system tube protein Hcp [Serratia proteamaculans]CAI2398721.1 Hemolysin-coregulated protein (uncharacterized) [Serratia proteamaculans]